MNLFELQYPIGPFVPNLTPTKEEYNQWVTDIEFFAEKTETLVANLTEEQLGLTYRENSWTISQLVHHCADSHSNAVVRIKRALTEDNPTISPYLENKWALLPDGVSNDIESSLFILKGLHKKWAMLLKTLTDNDLKRTFFHPEHSKTFSLLENIGSYAWHCNHHLEHIKLALR